MKRILWGLVLTSLPPCLSAALAIEVKETKGNDGRNVVAVTALGGVNAVGHGVVAVVSEGGDGSGAYSFVAEVADDEAVAVDGRSEGTKKVIQLSRVRSGDHDPNSGWLGVSVGEVADALATQLNLDGRGIVIQNVVKDSPADKAGLEAHDIILSIDGVAVGESLKDAVSVITQRAPGEVVNLMVLRNGVNLPVAVTLGSRADMGGPSVAWRYKSGANAVVEDEVHTRGKIVIKDKDGNWKVKELGSLDALDDLPADIRAAIPQSGTRTITVESLGDSSTIRLSVDRDGNSINIEQDNGGPITVTRTDAQGQSSTLTYETPEELESNDAEAFELYNDTGNVRTFTLQLDELGDVDGLMELDGFKWFGDKDSFDEHMAEWQAHHGGGTEAARQAFEEAMEELRASGVLPHGRGDQFFGFGGDKGFHFRPFGLAAKPRHTFEVRADGTIEVRIRKGDSELVQLYGSEADLQRRAPDLYEKYDELMTIDAE